MDLLHLVDRLEELVASAQKMPIGNRAIIDRRRLLDIIDQMRIAVPEEVREAQDIVGHREAIRREAEEEGGIIVAQAEERAARMVEANEITVASKRRAEEIAAEAELRLEQRVDEANADIQQRLQESRQISREQMAAADDYARELLRRLEHQLGTFVSSVRSGMAQLEPAVDARPSRAEMYEDPRVELAPVEEPYEEPSFDEPNDDGYDARDYPRGEVAMREPAITPDRGRRGEEYDVPTPSPRAASATARTPIPLRRDDEPEEELENLLRPRRRETVRPPALIDDFEHEPLDDDPLLGRHDREDGR